MGYYTYTASNKVVLHVVTTPPKTIKLLNYMKKGTLTSSTYYGINGGWFNMVTGLSDKRVLNIAMQDGEPVGPEDTIKQDGVIQDGSTNCVGRAAIAYNGGTINYYQSVRTADEIPNIKGAGRWAQGGVALNLGKTNWTADVEEANCAVATSAWTAMVADMRSYNRVIYLIVAKDPKNGNNLTPRMFRTAIEEMLNIVDGDIASATYKGILLDGSDSSQMRALDPSDNVVTFGGSSGRALCQIITYT